MDKKKTQQILALSDKVGFSLLGFNHMHYPE